jgi:Fic family protein
MNVYIHQLEQWPDFKWNQEKLMQLLTDVRHRQGRLLGYMEGLGFDLQTEASLETLTLDVLKSSEIEGELLNTDQVRSSIAKHLGIDAPGLVPADRDVEGIVEMMLDATQHYEEALTEKRLFNWHASLFPADQSSIRKIVGGAWRNNPKGAPMQVVSGHIGREKVHYQAPDADMLSKEMKVFIKWFNASDNTDTVIRAAIAHLWFVTIHPFDDGNGRIARAITDMELARSDKSSLRFYSMSAQIRKERNAYYDILEKTQKGSLDITAWLELFLRCLDRALVASDGTLSIVMGKAKFWDRYKSYSFNERQKLMLNKLLDGFTGKLTNAKWAKIAKCSSDTALRDINDLLKQEVLMKEPAGGRSTSYVLKGN